MIDKRVDTVEAALDGIGDGSSILVNGFGGTGVPVALIRALERMPARDLTLILNGIRHIDDIAPRIFGDRRISRVICSAARSRGPNTANYERQWLDGDLEIELVPQGSFAERIRAGGAGVPAFYTPTAVGTQLAEGKEIRQFKGRACVLETAITADFALIRAARVDRWGNARFRGAQGNFGLAMAMAAATTVIETGNATNDPIAPDSIDIPGIYVDRVFHIDDTSPSNAGGL